MDAKHRGQRLPRAVSRCGSCCGTMLRVKSCMQVLPALVVLVVGVTIVTVVLLSQLNATRNALLQAAVATAANPPITFVSSLRMHFRGEFLVQVALFIVVLSAATTSGRPRGLCVGASSQSHFAGKYLHVPIFMCKKSSFAEMYALSRVVGAADDASRDGLFVAHSNELWRNADGFIRNIGWCPRVRWSDRAAHEALLLSRFNVTLGIIDRDAAGAAVRSANRSEYLVYSLAAINSSDILAGLGFDILSEPVRRAAVIRSRAKAVFTLMRPTPLPFGTQGTVALGVMPVYRREYNASSIPFLPWGTFSSPWGTPEAFNDADFLGVLLINVYPHTLVPVAALPSQVAAYVEDVTDDARSQDCVGDVDAADVLLQSGLGVIRCNFKHAKNSSFIAGFNTGFRAGGGDAHCPNGATEPCSVSAAQIAAYHKATDGQNRDLHTHWLVAAGGRLLSFNMMADPTQVRVDWYDFRGIAAAAYLSVVVIAALASLGVTAWQQSIKAAQQRSEARERELMAAREGHERTIEYCTHHLRNPVHALRATAELMHHSIRDAALLRDVKLIIHKADQVARLLEDMNDLSALATGHLQLRFDDSDVRAMVVTLAQLYARRARVNIHYRIDKTVPRRISTDSLRLQQILGNGLNNACQHGVGEDIQFSVIIDDAQRLIFRITNVGRGLGTRSQQELMQPFYGSSPLQPADKPSATQVVSRCAGFCACSSMKTVPQNHADTSEDQRPTSLIVDDETGSAVPGATRHATQEPLGNHGTSSNVDLTLQAGRYRTTALRTGISEIMMLAPEDDSARPDQQVILAPTRGVASRRRAPEADAQFTGTDSPTPIRHQRLAAGGDQQWPGAAAHAIAPAACSDVNRKPSPLSPNLSPPAGSHGHAAMASSLALLRGLSNSRAVLRSKIAPAAGSTSSVGGYADAPSRTPKPQSISPAGSLSLHHAASRYPGTPGTSSPDYSADATGTRGHGRISGLARGGGLGLPLAFQLSKMIGATLRIRDEPLSPVTGASDKPLVRTIFELALPVVAVPPTTQFSPHHGPSEPEPVHANGLARAQEIDFTATAVSQESYLPLPPVLAHSASSPLYTDSQFTSTTFATRIASGAPGVVVTRTGAIAAAPPPDQSPFILGPPRFSVGAASTMEGIISPTAIHRGSCDTPTAHGYAHREAISTLGTLSNDDPQRMQHGAHQAASWAASTPLVSGVEGALPSASHGLPGMPSQDESTCSSLSRNAPGRLTTSVMDMMDGSSGRTEPRCSPENASDVTAMPFALYPRRVPWDHRNPSQTDSEAAASRSAGDHTTVHTTASERSPRRPHRPALPAVHSASGGASGDPHVTPTAHHATASSSEFLEPDARGLHVVADALLRAANDTIPRTDAWQPMEILQGSPSQELRLRAADGDGPENPLVSPLSVSPPVFEATAEPAAANSSPMASSTPTGNTTSAAKVERRTKLGFHVLYADDDLTNLRVMGRFLQLLGCTSNLLEDGIYVRDALRQSGQLAASGITAGVELPVPQPRPSSLSSAPLTRPYDIILLDIVMPQSDGAELCKHLRFECELTLPIVAVTANGRNRDYLQSCGFDDVVDKPCGLPQLREMVERLRVAGRLAVTLPLPSRSASPQEEP